MSGHEPQEPLAFERIVFFSDAVFAIAITLLVLEIKVPHLAQTAGSVETLNALARLIPQAIGFLVSFVVLGTFWIEHHRIFRYIARFDGGLLARNLAMLLMVAFVPFPTALFSENYTNPVALCIYALTLGGVGLSKVWIWRYAARGHRLLPTGISPALVRNVSWRSWAVPITALTVALFAASGVRLAYVGFAFIPLVAWLLGRGAARGAAVAALFAALAVPAVTEAQAIDTTLAARYRVAALSDRRAAPEAYWHALAPSLRSAALRTDTVGMSGLGRPLRTITFGRGPTTVLLWSQMHGDESTASMALADILRFFAEGSGDPLRERLRGALTVVMLPMLNPDGAARWQRENAAGIDVNRDARNLTTPEARALRAVHERIHPAYGFNLHDQGARVRAGALGHQVAIALLAPASGPDGTYGPVRARARQVASLIAARLGHDIPGRIAKYEDDFNPRAFGDLMQSWGTSTVLIESGAYPGDTNKQYLRTLNVVAILTALDAIASGTVTNTGIALYDALPYNTSGTYDILIRGATLILPGQAPIVVDLAANYADAVARRGPHLREVGDLVTAAAFDTVDASGQALYPHRSMLAKFGDFDFLQLGAPLEYDLHPLPH